MAVVVGIYHLKGLHTAVTKHDVELVALIVQVLLLATSAGVDMGFLQHVSAKHLGLRIFRLVGEAHTHQRRAIHIVACRAHHLHRQIVAILV